MLKQGFRTKREAEQAAQAVLKAAAEGAVTNGTHRTVGEYLDEWLQMQQPLLRAATHHGYAICLTWKRSWPNCSVWRSTWCRQGRCSIETPRSATTRSRCELCRRSSSRRLGDGVRRGRCAHRSQSFCGRRRGVSPGTIERCRSTPRPSELTGPGQEESSAHRSSMERRGSSSSGVCVRYTLRSLLLPGLPSKLPMMTAIVVGGSVGFT